MMNRLEFMRSLGTLGLAVAVLPACGKDDDPAPVDAKGSNMGNPDAPSMGTADAPMGMPDAPTTQNCATTGNTISSNHGHVLTLPLADANGTADKTYNIQGTSGHPHTVTITAAQFAMLRSGGSITVTSSNDANHTHNVTITCMH